MAQAAMSQEARRLHVRARALRVEILAIEAERAHLHRVTKWLWTQLWRKE